MGSLGRPYRVSDPVQLDIAHLHSRFLATINQPVLYLTMDHSMGMESMDGMAMSSSSGSSSSMSMPVVFTDSHTTPLFSNAWKPSSPGAYAGTCIFLVILAIIYRGLLAFKAVMERRWHPAHLCRRYVAVTGKNHEAGCIESNSDAKIGTMIDAQGVEENIQIVRSVDDGPISWRISVDLPRAGLFIIILGVSYLL